jgi:hypothetical protein
MDTDNLQEQPQETPQQETLQPVSITIAQSPKTQSIVIEVPAGHVLIVALHADGTEKEGSGFFYPEKSYQRFYGDETKFRIKKKAN